MTPSAALTNLASLIEAVSVSQKGPQDKFRRIKTQADVIGRDRSFVLQALGGPQYLEHIMGSPVRRFTAELGIFYSNNPTIEDRIVDDCQLITDRLETAWIDISGMEYSTVQDAVIDSDSFEGATLLSVFLEIQYDTTA